MSQWLGNNTTVLYEVCNMLNTLSILNSITLFFSKRDL